MRLEQTAPPLAIFAGRKARTRPCVGSCEASMDTLLSGYPPAASPNSHSSGVFASRGACAESRPHAVAYDLVGVRPQRARRKLNGARVSARNLPVEPSWSCRRRAPRHGCRPCSRGSRPSSRVPSALSLSASRFRDTHSTRTVQLTGTCRAPATVAARVVWVRVADGTTTALHPGPGKEGPA